MNALRDYYPKWSKAEKERQIQYHITYTWNLKYGTNELIYKTETDLYVERTDLCLPWGQLDWEFGVSKYKLLCIGWLNNRGLVYSMGNYISILW